MAIRDDALAGLGALVTGGSRGIGRAICEALAARGAKVAINYVSREDAAQETAKLVQAAGSEAVLAQFDTADEAAVQAGVTKAAEALGGLHIVVANAGIAINGLLARFKTADWERSLEVNLGGAYLVTRAASRHLLKAKDRGRLITLSSVIGEMGNAGQTAYAASKAALIGFTKSVAREFAPRGVCVNAVAPGFIETDMTHEHLPEAQRAATLAQIPLGRVGAASEVGDVVAFLAGPEAAYITGQVIRINGGMLM